jgi:hypothetical protein
MKMGKSGYAAIVFAVAAILLYKWSMSQDKK